MARLMTNVIDEVNAHQVEQYLSTVVGRHLPLGVLMRDHQLFDAADMPHPVDLDLYRAVAAAVVALIPFLGWLFVLALVLSGVGAITLRVARPRFFADAA